MMRAYFAVPIEHLAAFQAVGGLVGDLLPDDRRVVRVETPVPLEVPEGAYFISSDPADVRALLLPGSDLFGGE